MKLKEGIHIKIKLFTHTDLDGISCARLAYYCSRTLDVNYCNYDDVNDKVKQFIIYEEYKNYDYVFITDISVNEEVAELINNTHPDNFKEGFNLGEMFQLFDHHKTALWLNKYFWAMVAEESYGHKTCGTELFFNQIVKEEAEFDNYEMMCLQRYVENVRRYDTWDWQKLNDINPKKLNDLLYIYGRDKFIEEYEIFTDLFITDEQEFLLGLEQDKINRYVEKKSKEIIVKQIQGYKTGVIYAEQYHSELGNVLATNNLELDFIVIINPSQSVSYRGVKDVNLGEIAKIYGGGGHPKASGSPISDKIREQIINMIFE